MQCVVIWDGGGDSGLDLFGIDGNGLGSRAKTKEGNVCCIRLCPGALGEIAELVTDVDFVVECANHCMDTERSVCEYGLTDFWHGCSIDHVCKVVKLGRKVDSGCKSIFIIHLSGVC